MDEYKTQRLAEAVIRENPSRRILDFAMDGEKYWIKRKLGNGRNQLVKYSVEKEFYYEIARITIAGEKHPELVPKIVLLEPTYPEEYSYFQTKGRRERRNSGTDRCCPGRPAQG